MMTAQYGCLKSFGHALLVFAGLSTACPAETGERPVIPPSGPLDLNVLIEENNLVHKPHFDLGGDYQIVGQKASDSLNEEDNAWGGVGRLFGSYQVAQDTNHPGGLFFRIETRDKLGTELAPEDLGPISLGYLGLTAADWSDIGLGYPDLYWKQQFLTKAPVEIRAGRIAPVSFFNVTPFSDNLTGFMNLSMIFSPTVPYPSGGSLGAVGYVGMTESLYLLGTVIDANGEWDGSGDIGAGEFFKGIEFGWTDQGTGKDKPYLLDNIHISYWHRDSTDGGEYGQGVSAAAAYWFSDKRTGTFLRAGWSDAEGVSLLEKSASAGLTRNFRENDYAGIGISWGRTFNSPVDQITSELFYRFELSKLFAITPSLQLLANPIANPEEDRIWVAGIRIRLAL